VRIAIRRNVHTGIGRNYGGGMVNYFPSGRVSLFSIPGWTAFQVSTDNSHLQGGNWFFFKANKLFLFIFFIFAEAT
jgi:hypothetical protein